MVLKPDESWHSCGDCHHINLVSSHDSYPPPSLGDFSDKLDMYKFSIKINQTFQCPMERHFRHPPFVFSYMDV
jgi:hypothetical protein